MLVKYLFEYIFYLIFFFLFIILYGQPSPSVKKGDGCAPRNNYKGISEAVENLGFGLGSGFVGSYNSN